MPPLTPRQQAEQAYSYAAHDYARDPVGSRDWVLFFTGWSAAMCQQEEARAAQAAEMEALRSSYEGACKLVADMHLAAMGQMVGPVLGVVEDVAALRADAERYRWLRDGCDDKLSEATRIAADCYGMEWDAAIDAARAALKEQAPNAANNRPA